MNLTSQEELNKLLAELDASLAANPVTTATSEAPVSAFTRKVRRIEALDDLAEERSSDPLERAALLIMKSASRAVNAVGAASKKLPHVHADTRLDILGRLDEARAFIDIHFAEQLTVDQLAIHAALSSYHFLRLFSLVYGYTPYQYLTERRMANARHLLGTTSLAINEISVLSGFCSAVGFTQAFTKKTGMSPTSYRSSIHQKQ